MAKTSQHVVPHPKGGWSVRQSGASRATRVFANQSDAVRFAQKVAREERTELYVHRKDGTVRQKDSYGADPYPPRDRR
jgi:uncharacterized protein YdaT